MPILPLESFQVSTCHLALSRIKAYSTELRALLTVELKTTYSLDLHV